MEKILTIDLGTTDFNSRCSMTADSYAIVAAWQGLPSRQTGWLEMSADDFATAIARGIATLAGRAAIGLRDVKAISFATQSNSFLLLDEDDRPLTPILLWPDLRAASLLPAFQDRCDLSTLTAVTGVRRLNAEFALAKLFYIQQTSSDRWTRTSKFCLISDYLTLLFTGQHVTELGAAGLTGMVDIHRCRWWPEMLERFGIDECRLPFWCGQVWTLGTFTANSSQTIRLPPRCRFVVGCLDQYAGAMGVGDVGPGMISETTGTVLAAVRLCKRSLAAGGCGYRRPSVP